MQENKDCGGSSKMRQIFYFTADWCNPCQRTKPIAQELERDGLISVQYIDVDVESELTKTFAIRSVPTFVLMENGKEISRTNGAKTREQLLDLFNYQEDPQKDF